jgi:ADP-ribose 1''-phosphate phosphatase
MNEYKPDRRTTVGDLITEMLEERQMTDIDLAMQLECNTQTTLDILEGKTKLTPKIASQLERVFDVPKDFWLARDNQIIYRNGNLFSAEGDDILLTHACNCVGKWGSGIAAGFHYRYPESRQIYTAMCQAEDMHSKGRYIEDPSGQLIGCLFTSRDYGKQRDSVDQIVDATYYSIIDLDGNLDRKVHVHSPKINAGLFGVPWDKTADTITKALGETSNIESWTVWELI